MSKGIKNFSCNTDCKTLYKAVLNWCNLNEIDIEKSEGGDDSFTVLGKKSCPSDVKFSWAAAFGWLFFGFILIMAGGRPDDPTNPGVFIFPLAIYVLVYFIRRRTKTINVKIKSVSEAAGGSSVAVSIDKENRQFNSDISQFFSKYV